jgi:hypothetical protein
VVPPDAACRLGSDGRKDRRAPQVA